MAGVAFSRGGKTLALGGRSNTVSLLELASGKRRGQLGTARAGDYSATSALTFSPDGQTLVTGGSDQVVRVWDLGQGKELGRFQGHRGRGESLALAWAADGTTLVSGGMDSTTLVWSARELLAKRERPGSLRLSSVEVKALWEDLKGEDAVKAYQAIRTLGAAPGATVPWLQQYLKPVSGPDPKTITRWTADLEAKKFAVRRRAARELEKLGDLAVPALVQIIAGRQSLETRRRAEQLLKKLLGRETKPEDLQIVRALEVLERLATKEARRLLRTLAKGAAGARLTREARAALTRLAE
jgi:hypothetical protein